MSKLILTVDDSASMRQMVAFSFKSAGYTVIQAGDGTEALEKAKKITVNLVLTDQNMLKMDGLTLIRSLRALPQYHKTPILMLTTESGDEFKSRCKAAGATGWIMKPFNPEKLLEVVRKVIG
jgi:two-component system chemotaxis response regulator CheY